MKNIFFKILCCGLFVVPIFSKPIKIGGFEVAPFYIINESKKITGVAHKFMKLILAEAGLESDFVIYPYARMKLGLSNGSIDLAIFYPDENKTSKVTKVVESLGNDNLLVLKEDYKYKALKDIEGKRVAVIRTAKYESNFDKSTKIKKIFTISYLQSIKLFQIGRVDGFVIPDVALLHFTKSLNISSKAFSNQILLNHKKNWIYARKGLSKEIINKIKKANIKVIKTMNLKRLSDLY